MDSLERSKCKVTLKGYRGIEVEKPEIPEIDPQAVEGELEQMAQQMATVEVVDRAAKTGDMVNFDFEGFVDDVAFEGGKGEEYDLLLGSGQFIPGFEEQLVGTVAGQNVDVNVTFPTEYHSPELAGKASVFKCLVHAVKEMVAPTIDDEFAKKVSQGEINTLDELKVAIKEHMEEYHKDAAENELQNKVFDILAENIEGDIPEEVINKQAEAVLEDMKRRIESQGISMEQYLDMGGMDLDGLKEMAIPQAIQQIKIQLALDIVVREENIQMTQEEIDEEIENLAKNYNIEVNQVKATVSMETLLSDMLLKKAADFVLELVKEK